MQDWQDAFYEQLKLSYPFIIRYNVSVEQFMEDILTHQTKGITC